MAKGKRRQKDILDKKSRKKQEMKDASGESKYARKFKYLKIHNLWGFQIQNPKPWKS